MMFPVLTAMIAGVLLILQMSLGFAVSGARGKAGTWIGDGGNESLQRLARRHSNLAENAGVFVAGFALLELSGRFHILLEILCAAFLLARLVHAAGLSRQDTNNPLRLGGGVLTYLIGIVLGGTLLWISLPTASMLAA